MRQTLEVRLDAAEREREAAEQDKLQKEEVARKALVEQELIMEKVVQDSNILKREAEENAKVKTLHIFACVCAWIWSVTMLDWGIF